MSTRKGRAAGSDTACTAQGGATVLGITTRQLHRLVAAGTLPGPVAARGTYDLRALVSAFVDYKVEQAQDETPGPPGSARDRWWTARAAIMELDLAERRQSLVPAKHVTRALEFLATTFRARLLALPRKLAVTLSPEAPHETEQTIDTEARAILTELSEDQSLPRWLAEADGDNDTGDDAAGAGNGARDGARGAPPAS